MREGRIHLDRYKQVGAVGSGGREQCGAVPHKLLEKAGFVQAISPGGDEKCVLSR